MTKFNEKVERAKEARSGTISGKWAKRIFIALIAIFILLSVACPLMAEEDGSIVEPSSVHTEEQQPWSVSAVCSNRSSFKLFGSLASDNPVCGSSVSYTSSGGWNVYIHSTEEVGTHDAGVIAPYRGIVTTYEWVDGDRTVSVGLEIFDSPPYRGGQSFTFIAPLASFSYELTDEWTATAGAQYLGTHNTEWSGERVYGYGEVEYSRGLKQWTLGSSAGVVTSNTGRVSIYVEPVLEYGLNNGVTLSVSALWAHTEEGDFRATVPWTTSLAISYDF